MNNPITIQLQVDPYDLTEQEIRDILTKMHGFHDSLVKFGRVKSQMYLGEESYDGEPLI